VILPLANIFQPLIDVANSVLTFLHEDVGLGWGLSIIFLTFITRIVILPLTIRQIRGMQELQRYQPQIKEIQAKYKDDRQRMQKEMMSFYQEHKINPFASCLPLILQLPVFLSLFYLLRGPGFKEEVIASGNPGFLFIPSVIEKATGGVLVVLIVLYVGTQLGAGLVMAATADRNQRLLMLALPVIFVPIIINFPAGLVVYWITTNVWTVGQQYVVKRLSPPPPPPTEEEKRAAKAPPPPPRKKKKRSGKRR
jgi:YidC/Oxa1 family membrane protein insertase